MATQEELLSTETPHRIETCDIFVGIAGLADSEALRDRAETAISSLRAPVEELRVTLAAPGAVGTTDPGRLRRISYEPPGSDGAATPWSVAAASQRALLALAAESQARVCVLVNPDLLAFNPSGLEALALPVLDKRAELVLPDYAQGRFDSLINRSILSPLTRALYGKRVHHPLASDYAVSSRMVARLLQSGNAAAHLTAGSLLWPATVAATIDAPVAEAALGFQHPTRSEGLELRGVMTQLVGSLFADVEHNAPLWQRVRGSLPSLTVGVPGPVLPQPGDAQVIDSKPSIDSFLLGWRSLQEVWGLVLPPVSLLELKRLTLVPADKFRIPDELWVRIVYDFALAYRLRTISRTHLLGALTPLYLGWVASYVSEANAAPALRYEQLAKAFEDGKPYLVRRWRWPDRFNP